MTPTTTFTDPLTGPCARPECGKLYADHPGGYCPDGIASDGTVDVMDSPIYVPADISSATDGFARFHEEKESERAARDADYISWRRAELPDAKPGDPLGYVARNGNARAFARKTAAGWEFGSIVGGYVPVIVTPLGTAKTLAAAKERAFEVVRDLKREEETMAAATEEKTKKATASIPTADVRAALVAAIEEAVPGSTREWNKTGRYETFKVDGRAFGLVFKEGARSVGVKIPGQLRDIKVSEAAGFTKSDYGLTRSLTKKGDVRSVAKVFATAADAVAKKAEAEAPAATEEA